MKLLVCTYEYFPHGSGIANVVYNIVRELEKQGVDCTVCSPTGPDIKLGSRRLIEKTGILGMMDYWLKVSGLDMSKYDAVWLNQPIAPRKISHKNLVVTVHTTYRYYDRAGYYPKPYYKVSAVIERYCMNKFDKKTKFVCINESIFEELREIGIKKETIRIIPNGVYTKRFNIEKNWNYLRDSFGFPKDKKIILSLGRLTEQKQPDELMKLFHLIEKSSEDFFFVVGGKGELLEITKSYAKELGIKNIIFLGYVPEENLPSLYSSADYYILLSKYEALPLTLLDAMASGLPCLVTDIPGTQVIRQANCGIYIDTRNLSKGALDIVTLSEKNVSLFSKNALNYSKLFDWSNICKSYVERFDARCV
jgi:1,2-diacylglycerol 3-alpha-glucosyltransferase